jgi:predicted acyltransferase (DUF342 family)
MIIGIIIISFIILFFLPFIPGFIEIAKKTDAEPLYISMDYKRNPRYFAKSFKSILKHATHNFTLGPGFHNLTLSREETLEIILSRTINANDIIDHLIYTPGRLSSGANVQIKKEIYSVGDVFIGPDNNIQALCTEGDAKIGMGTSFNRWLDAGGDIIVEKGCNLGISVTSDKKIYLAGGCTFRRVFGMPITTANGPLSKDNHIEVCQKALINHRFSRVKNTYMPPETHEYNDIVFTKWVQIGYDSIFEGNIKSYGKITLEKGVVICGNVIADGDIFIGKNVKIGGHLFSQGSIHISEGSYISQPDIVKSIIAKKSIYIEDNVTIYGYVTTEGCGQTGTSEKKLRFSNVSQI